MTRTLSATLTAVVLLAACGGERRADTATQSSDSALTGASPAAPSDSAAQAAPTPSASADSAAQPVKPADTGAKSATAAKPAPKKTATATPEPKPAPKKAAVPAPSAAAPAPSQDTTKAAPQATEQADQPLRDAYHQAPKDTVNQATYDGWKQFNLNCARCHGEDALGTTIAPHLIVSLKPDGPINTKELFMQTVCAGRPDKGMPAWCALGLDMNTINDIYLYVKGRSDAKISPGRPAVKAGG